jgi:hypothetical protein
LLQYPNRTADRQLSALRVDPVPDTVPCSSVRSNQMLRLLCRTTVSRLSAHQVDAKVNMRLHTQ